MLRRPNSVQLTGPEGRWTLMKGFRPPLWATMDTVVPNHGCVVANWWSVRTRAESMYFSRGPRHDSEPPGGLRSGQPGRLHAWRWPGYVYDTLLKSAPHCAGGRVSPAGGWSTGRRS